MEEHWSDDILLEAGESPQKLVRIWETLLVSCLNGLRLSQGFLGEFRKGIRDFPL